MKHIAMALALGCTALSWTAVAGAQTRAANREEWRQEQRIRAGAASGDLSAREVERLQRGQMRIDRMQSDALRDGWLTPREQERIARAQAREDERIRELRRNDERGLGYRLYRVRP